MASLSLGGFYVYVAGSPFVMGTHYGVSSRGYAILFGLNAIPYVVVVQINGWLTRRFALRTIVRVAVGAHYPTDVLTAALVTTVAIVALLPIRPALTRLTGRGLDRLPAEKNYEATAAARS